MASAASAPRPCATTRNNAGVVCRRNNKTSGAYTSGAYDYPSGKFLTPITNGSGDDACTPTNHYVATPRHYWKTEVQWCDKKIATAGDKWLGYGTDAGGTCQPGKDTTHIYPRFFEFGAASYVDNYSTSAFQRVDLDITQARHGDVHAYLDRRDRADADDHAQLRRGDDQLRQLVRVLPDAHPGGEDGDLAHVHQRSTTRIASASTRCRTA